MNDQMPIQIGSTYRQKKSGREYVIAGFRSGPEVTLFSAPGTGMTSTLRLRYAQMPEEFEFVSCDHDQHCCKLHNAHSMPHRGCMLR